eukprot:g28425.t1
MVRKTLPLIASPWPRWTRPRGGPQPKFGHSVLWEVEVLKGKWRISGLQTTAANLNPGQRARGWFPIGTMSTQHTGTCRNAPSATLASPPRNAPSV